MDEGAAERDDGRHRGHRGRAERAVGDAEGEHGRWPRPARGEERHEIQ